MNASGRLKIILPLVSLAMAFAPSAYAQQPAPPNGQPPGHAKQLPPRPVGAAPHPAGAPQFQQRPAGAAQFQQRPGAGVPGRGPDAHFAHGGPMPMHNFGGHPYRGHVAWQGGRWHHEVHNGRDGWWWDVGGVWYYYPQPMDGPPSYVSEDYADDVAYGDAPEAAYAPPPGAYEPPPPPPAPDPGASAVGGAIVGGVLGGLLTGRASGAAAGAVIGGASGAIAGATAASRPGYYFAQGNCYYRYPNGQYVQADPRACY
jgi:hypothetical protein